MKGIVLKSIFFKALADETRLRIIDYLIKRNECVCICRLSKLLKKDPSVIFRHIQTLKDAGIIKTRKEAQFLFCCIKDKSKIKKQLEV